MESIPKNLSLPLGMLSTGIPSSHKDLWELSSKLGASARSLVLCQTRVLQDKMETPKCLYLCCKQSHRAKYLWQLIAGGMIILIYVNISQ